MSVSPNVKSVLDKLCPDPAMGRQINVVRRCARAFSLFTLVSMSACLLRKLAWSQTVAALSLSFHN